MGVLLGAVLFTAVFLLGAYDSTGAIHQNVKVLVNGTLDVTGGPGSGDSNTAAFNAGAMFSTTFTTVQTGGSQQFTITDTPLLLEVAKTYVATVSGDVFASNIKLRLPGSGYYILAESSSTTNSIASDGRLPFSSTVTQMNITLKNDAGSVAFDLPLKNGIDTGELTADGTSRAKASVPGYAGTLTWSIVSAENAGCIISPTTGELTAGREKGRITVQATADNGSIFQGELRLLDSAESDGAGYSVANDPSGCGSIDPHRLEMRFSVGRDCPIHHAGCVHIPLNSNVNLADPAALVYMSPRENIEIIRNANVLRQIRSRDGLLDILGVTGATYTVKAYYSTDIGGKIDQLYNLTGKTPFVTWTVSDPDGATAANPTTVSEVRDGKTVTHTLSWNVPNAQWEITTGSLRKYTIKETTDTITGVITNVIDISNPANGVVIQKTVKEYKLFTSIKRLIKETNGEGIDARSTVYDYYTGGQLKQVDFADKRWRYFQYDANNRLWRVFSSFLDQTITTDPALCHMTERLYVSHNTALDTLAFKPYQARTITESLKNQVISRSYSVLNDNKLSERQEQASSATALFGDSGNLVTVRNYVSGGFFDGWLKSISNPDSTMRIYSYVNNADGTRTTTVADGKPMPDLSDIEDGLRSTTVVGAGGQPLSLKTVDIVSSITVLEDFHQNFDGLNRPRKIQHSDGTFHGFSYDSVGIVTATNQSGTVTTFSTDDLKRRLWVLEDGVYELNTWDAADNLVVKRRQGRDNSLITIEQSLFNKAGRMTSRTNAVGGGTSFAETIDSTGRTVTITNPDGGLRTEVYYKDGSLKKITGSAVFPVRFDYGADSNGRFTKEIKLDASGNDTAETTTVYSNLLGKDHKTVFAAAASPYPYEQIFFNNKGQVWKHRDPDGVVTLYQYNAKGEREFTILDLDRDDVADFAGADRITRMAGDVITNASWGANVLRMRSYAWTIDNVDSSLLTSTVEQSVEGLKAWITTGGAVVRVEQGFAGNGNLILTETLPNGAQFVKTNRHGLLKSVTKKDSNGVTVQHTRFDHDAHDRNSAEIDDRNGTNTFGYNNADLLSTETRNPGSGYAAQLTTINYNTSLRPVDIVHSDGMISTNEYYPNGLLKKSSGARTTPEEHSYDAQGRIKTTKTWQNFLVNSGTAITTWNYNPYRGWLDNKRYPDPATGNPSSSGPDYTYKGSGRLDKRLWQRIKPTGGRFESQYTYNNAGDIASIGYGDGNLTPSLTYTYDRRGRAGTVVKGSSGGTVALSYNDADQLLGESYSAGSLAGLSVDQTFDSYLRASVLSARSGTNILASTTNVYDVASRVSSVSDGVYSAQYNYVPKSPLVSQIVFQQNGTTRLITDNGYDFLNRLAGITNSTTVSVSRHAYSYDNANQRSKAALQDGSYWDYQYDTLGQATVGKRYWADTTPVAGQQFEYTHDDAGNRIATKAGGDSAGANLRSASYARTFLNHYSSRTVPGAVDILGIAHGGSVVTVNSQTAYRTNEFYHKALSLDNSAAAVYSDVTVSASLARATTNRTGKVFIPRSAENFLYDLDGNLESDGRWTYTWDSENRLITLVGRISGVVPNRIDFEYDYLGRRIKKTVTNGSTVTTSKYLYRGGLLVGELNGSNGLIRSYMWGLDLSGSIDGAGGAGGLLAVKPAGGPAHFAGYDGNGNVTALVNGNDGSTSAQYKYGPFGELIRMSGAMAASNPIRFSSKFADDETDLIYYGFRYYNPSTGRWLCRDPIGEAGGMNLYAFARNLSLNAIDPWGLIEIPAGVQEYIDAFQEERGYRPWVGWWDTHQDRAFLGWYIPDDYELYGLVWYPKWAEIAMENRLPGPGDLPYGQLPPKAETDELDDALNRGTTGGLIDNESARQTGRELITTSKQLAIGGAYFTVETFLTGGLGKVGMKITKVAKGGEKVKINLGGEGEVPGAINQNIPAVMNPNWRSSQGGKTLSELQAGGNQFVVSSNTKLPFKSGAANEVHINNAPININTHLGPGVQSSEAIRILKRGGQIIVNGKVIYTKP